MRSCCPTRIALGGVDKPEICDAVVEAEGFYRTFLRDGFSRRRKISLLHENAGWAGILECWKYHKIVLLGVSGGNGNRLNRSFGRGDGDRTKCAIETT
jgi:hypothetical protein